MCSSIPNTLEEQVTGVLESGGGAKHESQWVSTGAYGMLQKLDPTFAQQVLNTNLYKIDTAKAKEGNQNSFVDVNAHFDKIGKDRPYATQREWAIQGGVPPAAIVEFMSGKSYFDQYDMETGAPAESALSGWQTMAPPKKEGEKEEKPKPEPKTPEVKN